MIAIQTAGVAFHPWAVEVQAALPTDRPPGSILDAAQPAAEKSRPRPDKVVLHAEAGDIKLDLGRAAIIPLRIDPFDDESAKAARIVAPCLLGMVRRLIMARNPVREPADEPIEPILARWREFHNPASLSDLVGLGCGATPSGDDILVGLLMSLTAWERHSTRARSVLPRLRGNLPAIAWKGTALPSAQMIVAACERTFPEPLVDLTTAAASSSPVALEAALQRVASLGHTSGVRILQGFLLGWNEAEVL